ncbi:MAG: CD1247 N-terminal domain-containing protein [Bacillota bacterium]
MKDIHNKISYLQGLAEGLNLDASTKEGKILVHIIGILDDMADSLREAEDAHLELESYVESIDEDLYQLEDDFYEDEDDDDEDDYDDDEDEEEYMEVECPKCHDLVYFETDVLDSGDEIIEVSCPNCDEVVFRTDYDEIDDDEEE